MLLTKCFHDTTDILQHLQTSTANTCSSSYPSSNKINSSIPLCSRSKSSRTSITSFIATTTSLLQDFFCCCFLTRNTGLKCSNILSKSSSTRLHIKYNFILFLIINLLLKTCCGQLLINVQNQVSFGINLFI